MVKNSSSFLQESESLVAQAHTMVKKDEHDKEECNQAAIFIQTQFRKHSEKRALAAASDDALSTDPFVTSKSSLARVSSDMEDSTTASIPLSFDNDDHSSISEEYSSDEYKDQFDAEFGEFHGPYYEGEKGMEEEKEEVKEPPPEQAPEKRSGKFLWGVAAGAVGLIGATMVVGMMSGGPVDEDDVVAVTGMVNSGSGGGGAGGGAGGAGGGGTGGAGGGGGATGATTSAQ
jgi:hypothetical protein